MWFILATYASQLYYIIITLDLQSALNGESPYKWAAHEYCFLYTITIKPPTTSNTSLPIGTPKSFKAKLVNTCITI